MIQALIVYPGNRKAVLGFISLCLWLGTHPVFAAVTEEAQMSEYIVDVWDIQDGLPHSTVTGIVQTPDGYLWCSSYDGVVRFDGVRFVRIGPDDRTNLQRNRVLSLLLDQRGQLWLGTDGAGLIRYRNGEFSVFSEKEGSVANIVFAVVEDRAGKVWLGTRSGLAHVDEGRVVWLTATNGFADAPDAARSLAFDREGALWIAESDGIKVLRDGKFTRVFAPTPAKRTTPWLVYPDSAGDVWAGPLDAKVWRRQGTEWSAVDDIGIVPEPERLVVRETRAGDIWVGTRKGLFRCRNGVWKQFGVREGLASPDVRSIFEDREGNLWIGTGAGGLARFKPRAVTVFTARNGLTDGRVEAVCESPHGSLWVGLDRGGLVEGMTGNFSPYEPAKALPPDAPVTSVVQARNGALWVGTFGNWLWRMEPGRSTCFNTVVGRGVTVDKITALLESRAGEMWVGTYFGLFKPLRENILTPVLVGGRFLPGYVTALAEETSGALWVAFYGLGVARILGAQTTWLTTQEGLPTDFVRTLHLDGSGVLWIGTAGGLCRWANGSLKTFTRAHGLVDNMISQIVEDDAGDLWLGSNQGIMRVARGRLEAVARGQKSALEVFVCGRGEGMLSLECAGGFFPAGLKTKDAKLWFPTAKGLVMADPSQMKQKANPLPPPVYIEEVLADGKSIMTAPLFRGVGETAPAPLVLAKGARRLELKFSALSLTAPEQVRFKHRLEGLDPEWTEADTIRSAVYPSVPPGRYQFQVIACNNDGVWNEKGAALAFTVLPAWWQSGVFRASALIGFAGLIGGGVRYMSQRRLRRKVERLEGQQALERERARIARDLHDDLGVSLTQIALLADMSRRDSASPEELKQTSATVALRARTLVRELDGILWTVNPKNDSLDKLATYLCQFSQQFFRIGTIACRLDVAEGIPNCPLTPEVRHDLFLVIKEALNNVAKHSGATEVWLRLSARNGHFEIRVEDNGRGFSPPAVAETERNGLRNMRTRVKELGGVFDVQSEPGNGTCVRVQFPLENVHAGRVNKSTI